MRQYWRDFESLERCGRVTCRTWRRWPDYLRDRAGTGFWHETYFRDGAVESVYIDTPSSGLTKFAPNQPGVAASMFSARRRLGLNDDGTEPAPVVNVTASSAVVLSHPTRRIRRGTRATLELSRASVKLIRPDTHAARTRTHEAPGITSMRSPSPPTNLVCSAFSDVV